MEGGSRTDILQVLVAMFFLVLLFPSASAQEAQMLGRRGLVDERPSQDRPGNPCKLHTINNGGNPCVLQSPLPYMLAGLGAMLLLVIVALIILGCSYFKGYFGLESGSNNHPNDQDMSDMKPASKQNCLNGTDLHQEKVVVILAGEDKPTHIAMPATLIVQKQPSDEPTLR